MSDKPIRGRKGSLWFVIWWFIQSGKARQPCVSNHSSMKLSLFSLFIQSGTPACRITLLTFRVVLLSSIKSLWKHSDRQTLLELYIPGDSKSSQTDNEGLTIKMWKSNNFAVWRNNCSPWLLNREDKQQKRVLHGLDLGQMDKTVMPD